MSELDRLYKVLLDDGRFDQKLLVAVWNTCVQMAYPESHAVRPEDRERLIKAICPKGN